MIILLSIIFCVRFNHAFGCVSQISFDVEVGSINIIEGGAVCCVHLARDLLELAALERVGRLKIFYFLILQALKLRNLHIGAGCAELPLNLDIFGALVTDQVENKYFSRRYFASLVSADDSIL